MSGQVPYDDATNPGAVMLRIMEYRLPEVAKHKVFVPFPDLATLLQKCWDRVPEKRPTIEEFLEPLRASVNTVLLLEFRHPLT